jgi:large subunit ribosomal protein L30
MAKTFRIKLKRSLIGTTQTQKDTVRCLGLKKRESVVVLTDNPAVRGQILKVQHLLDVKVEK